MLFESLALPAVFLVFLTALTLLISHDWRLSVAALGFQYIGIFLCVALSWPLEMAVVKLVAGWMAGAVLGMVMINAPGDGLPEERFRLSNLLFRTLTGILAGLVAISLAAKLPEWVPEITHEQAYAGLLLLSLGVLQLGLSARPLRVSLGLLTVLGGFEILYAGVESSTLVSGLLAGVNLGFSLIGAYLLVSPTMEEVE